MWVMTSKAVEHHVPLSNRVIQYLQSIRSTLSPEHGDFVFSTTNGRRPIDNFSSLKIEKAVKAGEKDVVLRLGKFERLMLDKFDKLWPGQTVEEWVWHDARRTVRSHLEPITKNTSVAEAAIGHGQKGIVRVYNLYKYRSEIRRAFNTWSELLHKIESGTCTLADWEHDDELRDGCGA